MDSRRQALLLWLQTVTASKIQQIGDIRDCRLLQILLAKVQGFHFKEQSKNAPGWKQNYQNLKQIYEQQTNFLQKNTRISMPNQLSTMNLVQMAKGQSDYGLQTLLYLTFLVCIQSSIRNQVITSILNFPNQAQQELMIIIKESSYQKQEENDRQAQINDYKQTISRLQLEINRLQYENQSLSHALNEDQERTRRNQQLLRKLQKQNQQLHRQLLQKSQLMVRQREDLMLEKYSSINQELVEDLKKQLIQREQTHSEQMFNLKETVNNLQAELHDIKKQNSQLMDDQKKRSYIQSRQDHPNCVPIEKHKAKLNQVYATNKEAKNKQMAVTIQNIKLKNVNAQLQSKLKKINEELYRKNNQFLVNKQDAGKLKTQFLSRIRDSLKIKLDEYKFKEQGPNNFADFIQNEAKQQK